MSEGALPQARAGAVEARAGAAPQSAAGADERAAGGDAVERVTACAVRVAAGRGARAIATTDLLRAVMRVYGREFDRVLHAHGAERAELLEQLDADPATAD